MEADIAVCCSCFLPLPHSQINLRLWCVSKDLWLVDYLFVTKISNNKKRMFMPSGCYYALNGLVTYDKSHSVYDNSSSVETHFQMPSMSVSLAPSQNAVMFLTPDSAKKSPNLCLRIWLAVSELWIEIDQWKHSVTSRISKFCSFVTSCGRTGKYVHNIHF